MCSSYLLLEAPCVRWKKYEIFSGQHDRTCLKDASRTCTAHNTSWSYFCSRWLYWRHLPCMLPRTFSYRRETSPIFYYPTRPSPSLPLARFLARSVTLSITISLSHTVLNMHCEVSSKEAFNSINEKCALVLDFWRTEVIYAISPILTYP